MGIDKRFIELPTAKLSEAPWNYKFDNPELTSKLKANLARNGQIENIIVREVDDGYEVVNGNHRLMALRELGVETVVCYNLGAASLAAAQRVAIETNETKFATDNVKLAEIVRELETDFSLVELSETMPFSEEELRDMNRLLEFDWSDFDKAAEAGSGGEGSATGAFTKTLRLVLDESAYDAWMRWKARASELLGYDSDARALEFAVLEALNMPEESLR